MQPMILYKKLFDHFGLQHWWPGNSSFEIAVGAILTQQTAWTNVEMAIENLKNAKMLDTEKIASSDLKYLEELIRPSGFFRQKAGYLKNFCQQIIDNHDGSIEKLLGGELQSVRKELLAFRGIGPETADSILLYAGNYPTFVVDAYTIRICQRTGMFDSKKYDEVKAFFEEKVKLDAQVYNEFHALLVELGKNHCTSSNPKCENCPVNNGCQYPRRTVQSGSQSQR